MSKESEDVSSVSESWVGARSCQALQTTGRSLNFILNVIGSHWKTIFLSWRVTYSHLCFRTITLAGMSCELTIGAPEWV